MTRNEGRLTVLDLTGAESGPDLARDVRRGLSQRPKAVPPVHFYDAVGSRLFEEITRAPEYYITRTEAAILARYADELAALCPGPAAVVELGSGSSRKTRAVLAALLARHGTARYAAVDVSRGALLQAAESLLEEFPGLSVTAVVGDYRDGLAWLRSPAAAAAGFSRKLVLYLGSSLGNFAPAQAQDLLRGVRESLGDGDALVLGVDLRKPARLVERAYNDAGGVTARFNLNLLRRINDELGGRFERRAFVHRAFYNEGARKIEMHLESLREQEVPVAALAASFRFARGETIHTEDAHKYGFEQLDALASAAGLRRERSWLDPERWFLVSALMG